MLKTSAPLRCGLCLFALCLPASLLTGCSGKDDAASAPGYYSGPMKAKAQPKMPANQGGTGGAAGQP